MQSFIFGGDTADPSALQNRRKVLEALAARASLAAPRNVGEGLSAIGQALAYRIGSNKLEKNEAIARRNASDQFAAITGALTGGNSGFMSSRGSSGTWTPEKTPKPTDTPFVQGGNSFPGVAPMGGEGQGLTFGSAAMTPQEMLIAGAEARGLDPIDVATSISYETGGTFDPLISGPTTKWGTHEGLIQFGDPQGEQHGAIFDQGPEVAMRSQLDPNTGAVWSYLDGSGVQPGMGLDNIYSAINAGAPGRFNASDAAAGGAPGTVADKVAGMGDHRAKAAEWLGGTWTPDPDGGNVTISTQGQGSQATIAQLAELAANPYLSDGQRMIAQAIIEQQLGAMDPLRQLQIQKAQAELSGMGQLSPLDQLELEKRQLELEQMRTGRGGTNELSLTPQYAVNDAGDLVMLQVGKDGKAVETVMPEGLKLTKGVEKIDLGDRWAIVNTITGEVIGEQPKNLRAAEAEKGIGKAQGEAIGAASVNIGSTLAKGQQALDLIDRIARNPNLPSILGTVQGRLPAGIPLVTGGQGGADVSADLKQLQGKVFLEAYNDLRGSGQITEIEGAKAEAAITNLERAQSPEAVRQALGELRSIIAAGMQRAQARAAQAEEPAGATYTFNPETGELE